MVGVEYKLQNINWQ
ncbi:hypothetical protein KIPB_013081, partial [Kipferlia bialata]|eukprot:g13081.t1